MNKLETYKKALGKTIVDFLTARYPVVPRHERNSLLVICQGKERLMGFIIDSAFSQYVDSLESSNINVSQIFENTLELTLLKTNEQHAIASLLKSIAKETLGYNLWKAIDAQLKEMPGWWQFYSTQRALTLALREVQNQFIPDELKTEDDSAIRKALEYLNDKIKILLRKIEALKTKSAALEEENKLLEIKLDSGDMSQDEALRQARETINSLESENAALSSELNEIISSFERIQPKIHLQDDVQDLQAQISRSIGTAERQREVIQDNISSSSTIGVQSNTSPSLQTLRKWFWNEKPKTPVNEPIVNQSSNLSP